MPNRATCILGSCSDAAHAHADALTHGAWVLSPRLLAPRSRARASLMAGLCGGVWRLMLRACLRVAPGGGEEGGGGGEAGRRRRADEALWGHLQERRRGHAACHEQVVPGAINGCQLRIRWPYSACQIGVRVPYRFQWCIGFPVFKSDLHIERHDRTLAGCVLLVNTAGVQRHCAVDELGRDRQGQSGEPGWQGHHHQEVRVLRRWPSRRRGVVEPMRWTHQSANAMPAACNAFWRYAKHSMCRALCSGLGRGQHVSECH
jgi:hypothetical protein